MTTSEQLDQLIHDEGILLSECHIPYCDGEYFYSPRIGQPVILVNSGIECERRKTVIKAHELGHHKTLTADLISAKSSVRSREEARAKRFEIHCLMSITRLIELFEAGCRTPQELSDALEIPISELLDGISLYNSIYGPSCTFGQHVITFRPFSIRRDRRHPTSSGKPRFFSLPAQKK